MRLGVLDPRAPILAALILLGAGLSAAAEGPSINFPGPKCGVTSPDGRYIVLNVDSQMDAETRYLGENHALYLLDLKTPTVKRIHPYGRSVSVLWSPRGSALLINDRVGSDSSTVLLVVVGRGAQKIDIGQQLKKKARERSIVANHHVYIEGVEWLAENAMKVKVHGYGDLDPNGFELWYEYMVGGAFKRLK